MNKEFDDTLVRFRKLPLPVRVVYGRPRTFIALAIGVAVFFLLPDRLRLATRLVVGWDVVNDDGTFTLKARYKASGSGFGDTHELDQTVPENTYIGLGIAADGSRHARCEAPPRASELEPEADGCEERQWRRCWRSVWRGAR